MEKRTQDLLELRKITDSVESRLTMILQSLQWDLNTILEKPAMIPCQYDPHHGIPVTSEETHAKLCFLKYHGYSPEGQFLPDVPDNTENSCVKLSHSQIKDIVEKAAASDPLFRKGTKSVCQEPLTLDRLQSTYTTDERRAIHDAVVQAAPALHDLSDLALPSGSGEVVARRKSRLEVLAELRDMKRRRAKYRVPANTKNYSLVLKDLIKTQMEFYTTAVSVKEENPKNSMMSQKNLKMEDDNDYRSRHQERKQYDRPPRKDYNRYSSKEKSRKRHAGDDHSGQRSSYDNKYKHRTNEHKHYEDRNKWSNRGGDHEVKKIYGEIKPSSKHYSDSSAHYDTRCDKRSYNNEGFHKSSRDYKSRSYSSKEKQDFGGKRHREDRERHKDSRNGESSNSVKYRKH